MADQEAEIYPDKKVINPFNMSISSCIYGDKVHEYYLGKLDKISYVTIDGHPLRKLIVSFSIDHGNYEDLELAPDSGIYSIKRRLREKKLKIDNDTYERLVSEIIKTVEIFNGRSFSEEQ